MCCRTWVESVIVPGRAGGASTRLAAVYHLAQEVPVRPDDTHRLRRDANHRAEQSRGRRRSSTCRLALFSDEEPGRALCRIREADVSRCADRPVGAIRSAATCDPNWVCDSPQARLGLVCVAPRARCESATEY